MYVCAECGQRYERAGVCATDGQPVSFHDDPLLGSELGRFRFARVIGEGGMGRVYLAVQPEIGSRVAVKVLASQTQDQVGRFFAEARAVNMVRHEHIVDVIDMAWLPDGRPCIVMEYVEGETLRTIMRANAASLGAAVQLLGEVLSALAAAHEIGIVHRDLKPDNVMITAGGHAKVLDFGIAKLAPDRAGNSPLTLPGQAIGTPEYMAPEQISGGAVDARTDVYAVGLVLFEVVTGIRPFGGDSDFEIMRAQIENAPPRARQLRPDLPPALDEVIAIALAKAPERRFQTATAMATALEHALVQLDASQRTPLRLSVRRSAPPPIRASRPEHPAAASMPTVQDRPSARRDQVAARKRRWPWVVLALGAVTSAAAIAVIATRSGSSSPAPAVVEAQPRPRPPSPPPGPAPQPAPPPQPPPPVVVRPPPGPTHKTTGPAPSSAQTKRSAAAVISTTFHPAAIAASVTADAPFPQYLRTTYDAHRFDPSGFFSRAQTLAKTVFDDAVLIGFWTDALRDDGRVDLTQGGRAHFVFKSARRAVRHNGQPDPTCEVAIDAGPEYVRVVTDTMCTGDPRPMPQCTTAELWRRARMLGAKPGLVADLNLADRRWFFSIKGSPDEKFDHTFDDDCRTGSHPNDGALSSGRFIDYDPKRFDPSGYLPKARALARTLAADAELYAIGFEHVHADGHVDLTEYTRMAYYEFRSAHPLPGLSTCGIVVRPDAANIGLMPAASELCHEGARSHRCTIVQLWKRALAAGASNSTVATIRRNPDGWEFSIDEPAFHQTFADDCPIASP